MSYPFHKPSGNQPQATWDTPHLNTHVKYTPHPEINFLNIKEPEINFINIKERNENIFFPYLIIIIFFR